MSYTVTILALPGTFASSLTGVMDFLEVANRLAINVSNFKGQMFQVRLLSQFGEPVLCSNGYHVSVDGNLAEDTVGGDLLFIPSLSLGMEEDLKAAIPQWQPYLEWVQRNHHHFDVVSSHCSGAFFLGETGLLNGHEATTSWWLSKVFERYYPEVNLRPKQIVIESGPFLICGSTTSYQEMLVKLVERKAGQYIAHLMCKFFMLDRMERNQALYSILPKVRHGDKAIRKAEKWIRENISTDIRVSDVAEQAAMSNRTLVRRFHKYFGESPQSYIQRIRIEKSKVLLETTDHRLAKIVELCGYGDESAFRRLFKKHCSISPREYRRRFKR